MNTPARFFISLATLCLLVGCHSGSEPESPGSSSADGKIEAVATVGMVADLVRQVGQEHVRVTQICGSGVDPHLYMPTRDDVQLIMEADVVFYCGLMLEGKMAGTLDKVGRRKPIIAVTDSIDPTLLLSGEEAERNSSSDPGSAEVHADPHVWNDVSLWRQCLTSVEQELSSLRPDLADTFAVNAEAYAAQLDQLHAYGRQITGTIPESSRLLITSHDAFSYFGRAYGLEVRGIQGISTESEAGLQQINALVDLLIERDVRAVFIESSVSPKNVEALIEGAASKGHSVTTGGTLFSDAMGPSGDPTGTYLGMLSHNLTTVTRALGGQVPESAFEPEFETGSSASTPQPTEPTP